MTLFNSIMANNKWLFLVVATAAIVFGVFLYASKTADSPTLAGPSRSPPNALGAVKATNAPNAPTTTGNVSNSSVGLLPQAATFNEAILPMPAVDQEYLKSLNAKFFGLLDYKSLAELQWKQDRGLPTLQDLLSLRTKPSPRALSASEQKALSIKDLSLHLMHHAVVLSEKTPKPQEEVLYMLSGGNLAIAKADAPLKAYLLVSTLDSSLKDAPEQFAKASLIALLNGDPTLANEIMSRYGRSNQAISEAAALIAFIANMQARSQISACNGDRYLGNPRYVEVDRKIAREQPCKQ
jgi:hypothetical protein